MLEKVGSTVSTIENNFFLYAMPDRTAESTPFNSVVRCFFVWWNTGSHKSYSIAQKKRDSRTFAQVQIDFVIYCKSKFFWYENRGASEINVLCRKPGSFVHCKCNVIITFMTMHDVLQKYNAEAAAYLGAKLYSTQHK